MDSYRGQTLAADGIAVGLVVVAANKEDVTYAKLGLLTYVFGAPIVHLTKNRGGRAATSIAMRLGFPLLGGMLASGGDDDDQIVLGVTAGFLAASIIDAAYLAKGDPPKQQEPAWTPTLRSAPGGLTFGVKTRF